MQSNSGAAFVVHNLADAKRALEIASKAGTDVTLLSSPSAAFLLGPRVFNEMISAALHDVDCSEISVDAVIDCGDSPGPALRAIKQGSKHILCAAPEDVIAKIKDIADASGVRVSTAPGPALDLGKCELDDRQLAIWIKTESAAAHV